MPVGVPTTHATLLARLSGGGGGAWTEFCERYGELIKGFARRRGLQPADCDDLLQNVLLSLSRSMPGFVYDPSKGKFRSYLKTVVQHAISDRFRQTPREAPVSMDGGAPDAAPGGDADDDWERQWQQYHLARAMASVRAEFNATDMAAFEAYALAGRDPARTGAELGLSVDQVYQAKSRILRRLSETIEAQVAEEG